MNKHIVTKKLTNIEWAVENKKGEFLGLIYYWKAWKCFIFEPDEGTIYSWECSQEITNILKEIDTTTKVNQKG